MTFAESLLPGSPTPLTLVQRAALALATPAKPGADAEAAIVSAEPAHARLLFFSPPGGYQASILPGGAGLEPALAEVINGWPKGVLHVVVLGADPREVLQIWKRYVRFFGDGKRTFSLHVRDGVGKLRTLRGSKLPPLQAALHRADALDGASPEVRAQLQAAQASGTRSAADVLTFQQTLRRQRVPVTVALVVACLAVFAAGWAFEANTHPRVMYRMGAMQGALLLEGEWWRLLAPSLLHAGPWHLLLNMVALVSLGSLLEGILGWRRFLLLFVACAIGGSAAIAVASPQTFVVGSSGAIWGLMAFELYLGWRPGGLFPEVIARQLKKAGVRVVAINVLISLLPGISLAAHLGGGLVGLALAASGLLTRGVRPVAEGTPPSAPPALTTGAALAAAALVASIVQGFAWGRPWDFARPELVRVELPDGFGISLPAVHTRLDESPREKVTSTTFGDLSLDGAVYRVVLGPVDPGTVADAARMEELKKLMAHGEMAGSPRQGAIALEQLDDRLAVTDHITNANGARIREWATYLGDHIVILHAVELKQPGAAPWEHLARPIFLSIRPPKTPVESTGNSPR